MKQPVFHGKYSAVFLSLTQFIDARQGIKSPSTSSIRPHSWSNDFFQTWQFLVACCCTKKLGENLWFMNLFVFLCLSMQQISWLVWWVLSTYILMDQIHSFQKKAIYFRFDMIWYELNRFDTVDGSEIPFPTTVWMYSSPVVNHGIFTKPYQLVSDRRISGCHQQGWMWILPDFYHWDVETFGLVLDFAGGGWELWNSMGMYVRLGSPAERSPYIFPSFPKWGSFQNPGSFFTASGNPCKIQKERPFWKTIFRWVCC